MSGWYTVEVEFRHPPHYKQEVEADTPEMAAYRAGWYFGEEADQNEYKCREVVKVEVRKL